MNGPLPAGDHDINVFRDKGLKDKIPAGKRPLVTMDIVERMPSSVHLMHMMKPKYESSKVALDESSRHESFNAGLKAFWCFDVRFRHGIENHRIVFEAVCVICQFQLENGSPLFDV
jgi:hypothetical protein